MDVPCTSPETGTPERKSFGFPEWGTHEKEVEGLVPPETKGGVKRGLAIQDFSSEQTFSLFSFFFFYFLEPVFGKTQWNWKYTRLNLYPGDEVTGVSGYPHRFGSPGCTPTSFGVPRYLLCRLRVESGSEEAYWEPTLDVDTSTSVCPSRPLYESRYKSSTSGSLPSSLL